MALALAVGVGLLAAGGSAATAATAAPAAAQTSAAQTSAVAQASGVLNAVLPRRILDTRTTTGGHHAKLGSSATMTLKVLGAGGTPAAGVSAVMVNVTAVGETARTGYLTLFPSGITRPTVSTLNYTGNKAVANQALVRLGANGTITIFNSAGSTDVIVDVEGWVGNDPPGANGQATTASPVRLLDTRTTNGGHKAPLANGKSLTLQVAGVGPVPTTGVSAVWANVTAVPVGSSSGYLTAYASGSAAPLSSTVNFMTGVATATFALLPVSASGAITITNHSGGANVLVDVAGWLSGGSVTADAGTQPIRPVRVLDTRTTTGGHKAPVGGNAAVSVKVLGLGGVPSSGVAAVVVHITGTGPNAGTYLEAFGTGYPRRTGSTLNLVKGATASNNAVVPVGPDGAVSVYNDTGSVNVVVDVQGWIAAPTLTVAAPKELGDTMALTSTDGEQALKILNNANHYAMTTWWNSVYPSLAGTAMHSEISPDDVSALSTNSASTNAASTDSASTDSASTARGTATGAASAATTVNTTDNTRRLCMEAYSLAVSLATGAYNPAGSGNVSVTTATTRTVQIISQVAAAHLVNKPGGWGATTESTFYAAYIGTAAWLLWDDLTAQEQAEVAKVVYFEAEWGMDFPMQWYANHAGTVLQPGNTGSDQDSWMPMAAQLATAMMPDNPHVPLWQNAVVREGLISWSRPSDDTNSTDVNGQSVASWIGDGGSNVLANGSLYNHNRIAPDYSTLIYQNMEDVLVSALAGQPAPQAVTTLVGPVYASYSTTSYSASSFDSPGGTVYKAGAENVYWPMGCDWGTRQYLPFALADAETAAFGAVNPSTYNNATYENLHASGELALQALNADGSSYNSKTSPTYNYVGREEHVAQLAAMLYLTMYVRDHDLVSFTPADYSLASS